MTAASVDHTPLGLYLHLPFCPSRCPYCDFFAKPFSPAEARLLMPALLKHLDLLAPLAIGRELETVYLGGGTPSMWPADAIARLLAAVKERLPLLPGAEVSLEANPGTVSQKKLDLLRQAGVNRLSLGAQSFSPALLQNLGRRHQAQDIHRAARQARQAGFANLNLDLIYALPGQTVPLAEDDVKAALEIMPEHLSLYELTLSPDTEFGRRYSSGRPPLPSETEIGEMERRSRTLLEEAGLIRYEVSNFARPGFTCRHNQSTWRGGDYLALGPGAHGHLAGRRWGLIRDIPSYAYQVKLGQQPFDFQESLSPGQQALERIMLGLRTVEGVDLPGLAALLRDDPLAVYQGPIARLQKLGWATCSNTHILPTTLGLDLADAAAELFA